MGKRHESKSKKPLHEGYGDGMAGIPPECPNCLPEGECEHHYAGRLLRERDEARAEALHLREMLMGLLERL